MSPRIDLSQLDVNERTALAALIKAVIVSDHKVSRGEQGQVARLSAALGEEHYRALLAVVDHRLADEESVMAFLRTITRQDARELIYGIVVEAASTDGMAGEESTLLTWLEQNWNVKVTIADGPPEQQTRPAS